MSALTLERLKQSIQADTVAALCQSYAIEITHQEPDRFPWYLGQCTDGAWFTYHEIQPLDPDPGRVTVFATEAEARAGDAEEWRAAGRQAVLAQTGLDATTQNALIAAILEAAEDLDPAHQGAGWPDPIVWDGRRLQEQAADLIPLLESSTPSPTDPFDPQHPHAEQYRADAQRLRQILGRLTPG